MADEQAPAEATADLEPQEQTDAQQPEEQAEAGTGRGDVSEALRQAREELRNLKAGLSDPSFVYQRARELGLTEEEAAQSAPPPKREPDAYSQYKYFRDVEKAQEKYPQLAEDEEDQIAVTALMGAKGLTPLQAADKYFGKRTKAAEAAKQEGAREKEASVATKERAQTAASTAPSSSDAAEYEDILARSRDQRNPRAAERAQLELIRWKEERRRAT